MSFIQIWAPSPLTRTAKRLKINSATSQRTSSPLGLSRFTFQRTQRHWSNPKRKEKNHTKHTNKLLNSLSYPKPKAAPKQWKYETPISKLQNALASSKLPILLHLDSQRRGAEGWVMEVGAVAKKSGWTGVAERQRLLRTGVRVTEMRRDRWRWKTLTGEGRAPRSGSSPPPSVANPSRLKVWD